jgi:hypothetical protein
MFKVKLKNIERKFNISYRTLLLFKKKNDYKKRMIECFGDLIILEELAKENLKQFTQEELSLIKNAIKKYLTELLSKNNKEFNEGLIGLIKSNELFKKLIEKEILDNNSDPRPVLYKIEKLDKLDKYFLINEIFDEIKNNK